MSHVIEKCITAIEDKSISDSVHILRLLQSKIVTGRKLEIDDENSTIEGKTNFILVDRENLLQTAFEEIPGIEDLRFTLEVNFYGEVAVDLGGPRKEFFRIIMKQMEEKYFQPVLGDVAAEDYVTVGKIHALSILQNGKLPVYDQEVMQEVFESKSPRPALLGLRRGLDSLGIVQIANSFKMFLHLLRPCNVRLTFRRLMSLLVAYFHEVGSNRRKFENLVYTEFLTYVREVSSERREGVSIHEVLQFITRADAVPALGFGISPSISFVEYSGSFLPTANTCINRLSLPRPTSSVSLPKRDVL